MDIVYIYLSSDLSGCTYTYATSVFLQLQLLFLIAQVFPCTTSSMETRVSNTLCVETARETKKRQLEIRSFRLCTGAACLCSP